MSYRTKGGWGSKKRIMLKVTDSATLAKSAKAASLEMGDGSQVVVGMGPKQGIYMPCFYVIPKPTCEPSPVSL